MTRDKDSVSCDENIASSWFLKIHYVTTGRRVFSVKQIERVFPHHCELTPFQLAFSGETKKPTEGKPLFLARQRNPLKETCLIHVVNSFMTMYGSETISGVLEECHMIDLLTQAENNNSESNSNDWLVFIAVNFQNMSLHSPNEYQLW